METFESGPRKWTSQNVAELLITRTELTTLTLTDALKVVQLMTSRRVKAGTVLIQEGASNSDYMVLILRGEAIVQKDAMKKSDTLILSILRKGQFFGEMGLFNGDARTATCVAFTDMDLAVLERDKLATLMTTEPAVACKLLAVFLQHMSSRLNTTNQKLRVQLQINRTLDQEVADFRENVKPEKPWKSTRSRQNSSFLKLP